MTLPVTMVFCFHFLNKSACNFHTHIHTHVTANKLKVFLKSVFQEKKTD